MHVDQIVSDFLVSADRFALEPEPSCAEVQILRAANAHCPPKTNYGLILLFIIGVKANWVLWYAARPWSKNPFGAWGHFK